MLALLPFPILYGISNGCYWLFYKGFGYRKKVVFSNIRNAFPNKSSNEIQIIADRFYRSFFDQWIETVKLLTLSKQSINKRIAGNWEVFSNISNTKIYALLGHRFNWEWGNIACQINSNQQLAAVYLPIANKAVDKLLLKIRSRMHSILVPANHLHGALKQLNNQEHILCFLADQTPANLDIAKWYNFLHTPAPFLFTPEKAARRAAAAVVYASIYKVKRGYYKVELELLSENAATTKNGFITQLYVRKLSTEINEQPENWLWSHRRWKRQPEAHTIIHES